MIKHKEVTAVFFIDGFNIYHAVERKFGEKTKYKWLDLKKLSKNIVKQNVKVKQVLYFSAYCAWNPQKKERHKKYIKALSSRGVQLILGKFQRVTSKFRKDKMTILNSDKKLEDLPDYIEFQTYEEKKTDVNIAVKLIETANLYNYDVFYILSADSDFVPALKYLKKFHRKIKLINVLPPGAKGKTIGQVCDEQIEITEDMLKESLLKSTIRIGQEEITRPKKWSK